MASTYNFFAPLFSDRVRNQGNPEEGEIEEEVMDDSNFVTPRGGARNNTITETPTTAQTTNSKNLAKQNTNNTQPGNSKRTYAQRSPDHEEIRQVRSRVGTDFALERSFEKIGDIMRDGVKKLIEESSLEEKDIIVRTMDCIMGALEAAMSATSDGLANERMERQVEEIAINDRIKKVERKVEEAKGLGDALYNIGMSTKIRDSEQEMEVKVRSSLCQIKLLDIDIGRVSNDRKDIVGNMLSVIGDQIYNVDRHNYDRIMRRTRVVPLGKTTIRQTTRDNRTIFSCPFLLTAQDKIDCTELEAILKHAGFHPQYHWPMEMIPYVTKVRETVKSMGVSEDNFIKVRPEERDGTLQVKVEVKPKNGGRWQNKAIWRVPPMNQDLWGNLVDFMKPKLVFGQR